MEVAEFISDKQILLDVNVTCTKQAFCEVANIASVQLGVKNHDVLEGLQHRERLGCTAVGKGVSIPHARIEGLEEMAGYFVRLKQGVDMDAPDDIPVDLMFVLLAPIDANAEHVKAMARISRILRNEESQDILRQSKEVNVIYHLLTRHDVLQEKRA